MTNYLYVFRGGQAGGSPQEREAHMKKWAAWIKDLGTKGLFKGGEPLDSSGKVVSGDKKVVTDGPFAEAKDLIGGYLVVSAENLDHATELAKGCPILEGANGTVEVRPIMAMAM